MFLHDFAERCIKPGIKISKRLVCSRNCDIPLIIMKTVIVLLLVSALAKADPNPVVKIRSGELLGCPGVSREGRQYFGFKGIPYGKVVERFQVAF